MSIVSSIQVLRTPELLEHILLCLLDDLHPLREREDPRSRRTDQNAAILKRLLSLRRVNTTFNALVTSSLQLRRALFLCPAASRTRGWSCAISTGATLDAPTLNPIVQTTFPSYQYRFWHLSLEASGNKYCALMIITRDDVHRYCRRASSVKGKLLPKMQLSIPPMPGMEAVIWEERDETKDYVGRTTELEHSIIRPTNAKGLTVGELHDRVGEMFEKHKDVAAIKLTTL
ncbi:hypothetical protein B0A48_11384 [Cryoendolithus antarcticus]|uniref:Uncharacterized protein n=1 Tax=Cryoendolithus antarcticus TaxID=1507870 RepID=A0A1V8SVL9_9PEZI|nr:hypothetical protein B0A48_11384 [Cryoendolithus antarcticus]